MNLIRLILLSLFVLTQAQADSIYNLIKIPNLEIYDIKTPNNLRYFDPSLAPNDPFPIRMVFPSISENFLTLETLNFLATLPN